MDVVAGVASVTQLAVYSQYAVKHLLLLYNTARDALSLVKCQQEDILVLLQVIHRLNSDNSSLDSDLLLPVLIGVIDIAHTLSNWFNESGVLGIKWTLIKRRSQIDDALKILKRKSDTLGLYLVDRNHAILLRLETSLNKETRDIAGSIENMIPGGGRKRLKKRPNQEMDLSQTSSSQSLVGRNNIDDRTREIVRAADSQMQPYLNQQPYYDQQPQREQQPHRYQQQQDFQSEYQQSSSANQSNDQTLQERQRATSKFTMHENKLDGESSMFVGVGWKDGYRGWEIDCGKNEGKNKSTFNFFNENDYRRAQEEQQLEVSRPSSHR